MDFLRGCDPIAYVRYASVYRDFRETEDFARFLGEEGLGDAKTASLGTIRRCWPSPVPVPHDPPFRPYCVCTISSVMR